jgi:SAM-dependent methyltransferase
MLVDVPMKRARRRIFDVFSSRTEGARQRAAEGLLGVPNERAGDRAVSGLYFHVAAREWARLSEEAGHLAAFRAGLAHLTPPDRVLDLGTGTGASAALVAAEFPDAEVVGVDVSRRMVRFARQRHSLPNLSFVRASSRALPFDFEAFDLVTLLHAVADLAELARILRPGGLVLNANRFLEISPDESEWVHRWVDSGFFRRAGEQVEHGYWEIFERTGERP